MVTSTTVKITNCTTETVKFVTHHDYSGGHIKDGDHYPEEIKVGQTIEFVFVSSGASGSASRGAVVYQGQNEKGKKFDWMYAWLNTAGRLENTYKAYTQIAEANYAWNWKEVEEVLNNSGTTSQAEYENSVSQAAISKSAPATYQGTMALG